MAGCVRENGPRGGQSNAHLKTDAGKSGGGSGWSAGGLLLEKSPEFLRVDPCFQKKKRTRTRDRTGARFAWR